MISEFEARRIQRMVARIFLGKLRHGESIVVSGWREGDWACVRWELADAQRAFVYPVDCRVDTKRSGLRETAAKELALDFLGHFYELFLADRQQPFTGPKWESVQFAGKELWVRGQVCDELADLEADEMLSNAARTDPSALD